MANREIKAGDTIVLRARFQDDIKENVQANNVWLSITDPNGTIVLSSGDATYFGEGIFEYSFDVPDGGPDGSWHDHWYGDLSLQRLDANLTFFVAASGEVQEFSNQLNLNNVVEVTLDSGIRSLDGSHLSDGVGFSFMTKISPGYSNTRKVRLEIGGFLPNVEDDTIQTAILEASIEADDITFAKRINKQLYDHAKREYVTCKVAFTLLSNLGHQMLRSKTLGDLSTEYDTQGLRLAIERAFNCMERWQPQVMSGGFSKKNQQPKNVIKGDMDPDRPVIGRMWYPTNTPNNLPAANLKTIPDGHRRAFSFFRPTKKWW